MQIQDFFNQNPRIAVAFSGGVDSSYLLYAAKAAGCDVRAYLIKTQFQPEFEINDATRFAKQLGVPLTISGLDILRYPAISKNPHDRCYYCKTAIVKELWVLARADGITVLCDGTNADDDEKERPGMRAVSEQGVISPLRLCGLTKADIRSLSKKAGLFTYDKPSYSCLATRIPAGTQITTELLKKVERAESALMHIGFTGFRVRMMEKQGDGSGKQGDGSSALSQDSQYCARIQMPESQWNTAADRREEILEVIKPIFSDAVLDLVPRPG